MPGWVKAAVDLWVVAAGISAGRLFRCVCRAGKHWGDGVTERVVWHVVKQYAKKLGFARLAPHDLRRSCAKLCHSRKVKKLDRFEKARLAASTSLFGLPSPPPR